LVVLAANADRPQLAVLGDLDRVAVAVCEFTVREAQHPPAARLVVAALARGAQGMMPEAW
jgi:hypothetical protein